MFFFHRNSWFYMTARSNSFTGVSIDNPQFGEDFWKSEIIKFFLLRPFPDGRKSLLRIIKIISLFQVIAVENCRPVFLHQWLNRQIFAHGGLFKGKIIYFVSSIVIRIVKNWQKMRCSLRYRNVDVDLSSFVFQIKRITFSRHLKEKFSVAVSKTAIYVPRKHFWRKIKNWKEFFQIWSKFFRLVLSKLHSTCPEQAFREINTKSQEVCELVNVFQKVFLKYVPNCF